MRMEIILDANNVIYDGVDFCYLCKIYVGDTCWYIGRHTTLASCEKKFREYRKHFNK